MRQTFFYRYQLLLALTLAAIAGSAQTALSQEGNRAAIVVSTGDGSAETRCVAFSTEEISGLELLRNSGFETELDVKGFGSAVCRIDGVGCAAADCFCQCSGGNECVYWSYWHLKDNSWQYAAAGAGGYRVKDGDVDGWTWGSGSLDSAVAPPAVSFQEICDDSNNLAVFSALDEDSNQNESLPVTQLILLAFLSAAVVFGFLGFRRWEART